jgi:hypothetical protein
VQCGPGIPSFTFFVCGLGAKPRACSGYPLAFLTITSQHDAVISNDMLAGNSLAIGQCACGDVQGCEMCRVVFWR